MKKQKGFTIAELLVVIAIIGLLSSIVLVSVKNVRGKARVASGLQFEASVYHALGAEAVGIWDFDDQQNPTKDSSGYNNNGTLTNGPTWKCASADPENTPSRQGCSLEFDGENDYVEVPDASSLKPTKGITIAMWFYLNNDPECDSNNNWRYIVGKQTVGSGGYFIILEQNRRITFSFYTQDGLASKYGTGIAGGGEQLAQDVLPVQEWTFFVVTYNALNSDARIYLNGQVPRAYWWFHNGLGEIKHSSSSLRINYNSGASCPNGEGNFPGKIDNVRIYGESLSSAQIQKLYVEGAEKHGLLAED